MISLLKVQLTNTYVDSEDISREIVGALSLEAYQVMTKDGSLLGYVTLEGKSIKIPSVQEMYVLDQEPIILEFPNG